MSINENEKNADDIFSPDTSAKVDVLPYEVDIDGVKFGKGVKLQTLVNAATRWKQQAALQAPRSDASAVELVKWLDPVDAPYGTELLVKTHGGAVFLAKYECNASVNSDENACDQWQAVNVHPECWTNGCCWESNADEMASDPVVGWINLSALHPTKAEQWLKKVGA